MYSTDSTGNTLGRSDVGANTSANLSSLADGATYVFYVTAYDKSGKESDPSNRVMLEVTLPKLPPVVASKNLETSQNQPVPVVLSGSSASGAALTYKVISGPRHGSLKGAAPISANLF